MINHLRSAILAILILTACRNSNGTIDLATMTPIKVKTMTYPLRNISISINRQFEDVYQFASNPENLPKWIAFVKSVSKKGDRWSAKTDLGDISIKFTAPNNFGIIDHIVTLADGEKVNNPMRVITNGNGSAVIFTLFWLPGRTEEEFIEDAKAVESDLQTLKKIMES